MTGPLLLALARRVHAIRIVACSPDAPPGLPYPGIPDSFFLPDGRVGAVLPQKVEAWRRENQARLLDELGIDVLETDEGIVRDAESARGEAYPGIPDSFFLPDGRVGAVPPEKVEAWRRENLPPWMAEGFPLEEELEVAPLAGPSNLANGLNVTVAEVRAIQAAEREAGRAARVAALAAAGLTKEEARRVLRRQPLLSKMAPETLAARLAALGAALPRAVVTKVALTAAPVLCHDLSRSLPAKLESLASLDDPAKLLARVPTWLGVGLAPTLALALTPTPTLIPTPTKARVPTLLMFDSARLDTKRAELRVLLGPDFDVTLALTLTLTLTQP
jgi:hypothetical protein